MEKIIVEIKPIAKRQLICSIDNTKFYVYKANGCWIMEEKKEGKQFKAIKTTYKVSSLSRGKKFAHIEFKEVV